MRCTKHLYNNNNKKKSESEKLYTVIAYYCTSRSNSIMTLQACMHNVWLNVGRGETTSNIYLGGISQQYSPELLIIIMYTIRDIDLL